MITIVIPSLSGGQGKTTTALMLGQLLANRGYPTLAIDADPQHSLTTYLGIELEPNQPTLLEVIRETVDKVDDAIYPVAGNRNLFLIPADDELDSAADFLAQSGVGAMLLMRRLEPIADLFKFCVIDPPPQRSQICLTAIGAADTVIIPAETSPKGFGSLLRTLELLSSMQRMKATSATVMGVLPFRDRWFGHTQSRESSKAVAAMKETIEEGLLLPSVPESERYKQAMSKGETLADLGYPHLQHPFEVLIERILGAAK
jgi:chromosome partitioning protein